jgi:hypothetical protein
MITKTGKGIIAKYLIGQAPAYASYIAIGCGAKPLSTSDNFGDYTEKKALDFEMFRVPVTSRGYVTEDNVTKIVLTAELPTEERYEMSEVGVFSAGSNPLAGAYDSRALYAFTTDEAWEYHTASLSTPLEVIYEPLHGVLEDGFINQELKVFQTNSDNLVFTNPERVSRYERARFFNNIVMMRGDTSDLTADSNGVLSAATGSQHIHTTGVSLDFNKNAPTDEIKVAFSVINKNPDGAIVPDEVRILVEFSSTDVHGEGQWAKLSIIATNEDYDFATNRYVVSTKQLQELAKSQIGFTWNAVNVVSIYSTVLVDSEPSDQFYVGLDAIRLENVSSENPLYGLTGYSVLKNNNANTIVKPANTTNYLEFRFAIGVD